MAKVVSHLCPPTMSKEELLKLTEKGKQNAHKKAEEAAELWARKQADKVVGMCTHDGEHGRNRSQSFTSACPKEVRAVLPSEHIQAVLCKQLAKQLPGVNAVCKPREPATYDTREGDFVVEVSWGDQEEEAEIKGN